MMYLVTRNRLGQPPTTDMDEFIDGEPTGKIVVASRIIDGKYLPIYKGEEPFEPDPEQFSRWFQKLFNDRTDRKTFAETIGEPKGEKYEVYVLEFDWTYGHRKEDCRSIEHARQRQEKWQAKSHWAEFYNLKINKDARNRNIINLFPDKYSYIIRRSKDA